jgi:hypothetical protein
LEDGTQRHGAQALRRATQKQTSGLLLLKKLTDLRGWARRRQSRWFVEMKNGYREAE